MDNTSMIVYFYLGKRKNLGVVLNNLDQFYTF